MSDRSDSRSRLETTGFADAVDGPRAACAASRPTRCLARTSTRHGRAGVRAANAGNAQMWRFVAVEDAGPAAAHGQAVDDALDEMARLAGAAGREQGAQGATAPTRRSSSRRRWSIAVFGLPYVSLADELLLAARPAASRSATGCARGRTCRASARPSSCSARRRTPWATAPAG